MTALRRWGRVVKARLADRLSGLPLIRAKGLDPYDGPPPGADPLICSWTDACALAASFEAVISIESPDATTDNGRLRRFRAPGEPAHQVLCFHDVEETWMPVPPRRRDVREGLMFARQHAGRRLLIHCHAGVSRSTALAYAILIDHHRARGDERRMLERLLALRPQACPNRLVVRYADELLGCAGRMIAAVEEHPVIQETRRRNFSPPSA